MTAVEAQVETIIRRHPEWLAGKKSLRTPFGLVKFTASQRLEVLNEELSIALIQRLLPEDAGYFIRKREELNLDALGELDDAELGKLKIRRLPSDNFKIEPARADLSKATLLGWVGDVSPVADGLCGSVPPRR